jgi:two-component system cell cycle response regulator
LPKLGGYEVARWLKNHPRLRTIPLIAVTALAMVGDRDKVLAAGFDGYIAKPISPETFVREVEKFLRFEQGSMPPPLLEPTVQTAPPQSTGTTILVVDNSPVNIELARSILEPFGYAVITATGISEGFSRACQAPPDLILSDVNMSGGTGYDFIKLVKADPQLHTVPFIFITSTFVDASEQARGLALGAAKFILRPIEPRPLLAAIEDCLRVEKQE